MLEHADHPLRQRERRRFQVGLEVRLRRLVPVFVVWGFALGLLLVVSIQQRVPAEYLVLDAASVAGGRWYFGAVTSLGIVAWTVAASACAATSYAAGLTGRRSAKSVFGRGAGLVALLLVDDLFLVHSWISTVVAVPTGLLPMIEVGLIIAWLATGWPELRRTRWELLAASGAALSASTLIDLLGRPLFDGMWTVAEEGAKFLGILALSVWAVHSAGRVMASMLGPAVGAARTAQELRKPTDP